MLAEMKYSMAVIAAVNDDAVLASNLSFSDMIHSSTIPLQIERQAVSAPISYNLAIDSRSEDILIFAHQDVYFPAGWELRLNKIIQKIEIADPNWALLSPFGISQQSNEHVGSVWSSSLGSLIGTPVEKPEHAQSFDEMVIVLRRSSGLRFDENLPGFHLHATDIVQTSIIQKKGAYIVNLPLVHNDSFHEKLGPDFAEAAVFLRKKFEERLPIRTPCVWLTRSGFNLLWQNFKMWRSKSKRKLVAIPTSISPKEISKKLGWE